MKIINLNLLLIALILFSAERVSALDFDKEMQKNRRPLVVKYVRGARNPASFYRQFPQCQKMKSIPRLQCNQRYAAVDYNSYLKQLAEARQRRLDAQGKVEEGDVRVSLEPKSLQPILR